MAHNQPHADAQGHGGHQVPPTTVRQYVIMGVFLTVVTAIEFLLVEFEVTGLVLVPTVLVLTAAKFVVVVVWFMHLRWDHPLLTRLFTFGFLLASAILLALIALFWLEHNDSFNFG
jgi:cytochrome c oxidase subunit 4